jgi:aldehyde dehydrogenase (NAD+)
MWTYGASLEPSAGAHLKPTYHPFVDGGFVDGEPSTVLNPATEEALAEIGAAGAADVDRAVAAARRARASEWGALPAGRRALLLFRLARVVAGRAQELAVLETLGTGRPIRRTRDVDLPAVVAHLFSCAGWSDKLAYAGYGPAPRPVGVVGALVGGGSPLLAAVRVVAPALACGNAVVLRPGPDAPLTALVLAEAAAEAGLPAGALNVLPGATDLAGQPDLDAVVVTGSATAWAEAARDRVGRGRLTAEPAGRAVHVVHDDAPLDQAVDGVAEALGTDQRVLVAEAVADELGELLRERLARLRVGDPLDRNTDVGPVVSRECRERAVALAAAADDEGAHRWTSPAALPDRGLFLAPTIFTGVAPTMRLHRAEVEGPVVPVLTFRTPAEAVALAKGARAAAVWADKGSKALWTAERLGAEVVWVNAFDRSDPAAPGRAGLGAYLEA